MVKIYQKSLQLFDIHNLPHSMQRSVGAGFCPSPTHLHDTPP